MAVQKHYSSVQSLSLALGGELENIEVAYQTYGQLNSDKSNAVLICSRWPVMQNLIMPLPKKKRMVAKFMGDGLACKYVQILFYLLQCIGRL